MTLVLNYHAIERGPSPLCIEPRVFAAHLDCIVTAGLRSLTVSQLAEAVRKGEPLAATVGITFDDAFASVVEVAVPLLEERGLNATVFCVAGHLGGRNDWPSSSGEGPTRALARAEDLAELARRGVEIGSHGMHHAPLVRDDAALLRRELTESRRVLEDASAAPVTSYAYPYGAEPVSAARRLVEETYRAACTTRVARVTGACDPYALPRVDAHYLRRPELLSRALTGSLNGYLSLRRVAAGARRAVRKDYVAAAEGAA